MIGQVQRVIELKRLEQKDNGNPIPKIFAFTSGKGGTGKTVLAVNFAYALSQMNKKVLLIDLDSNLSNIDIMLNQITTKTIYDFYTAKNGIADLITTFEPKFHIIFGDSGRKDYPNLHEEQVKILFSQLKKLGGEYDFILLDTGSGANETIVNILANSDCPIIITTPEPTAVMDAYVIVKILNSAGSKNQKLVIVNRCLREDEGQFAFGNLLTATSHFLQEKINFLGSISFGKEVSESIIQQEILLKFFPNSAVTNDILAIAKKLVEYVQMANIEHLPVSIPLVKSAKN